MPPTAGRGAQGSHYQAKAGQRLQRRASRVGRRLSAMDGDTTRPDFEEVPASSSGNGHDPDPVTLDTLIEQAKINPLVAYFPHIVEAMTELKKTDLVSYMGLYVQ